MKASLSEEIVSLLSRQKEAIEDWYQTRLGTRRPPVYSSVDLRNAGFKISVVDTNLFPAGFNNLCETFSENASETFRNYLTKHHPAVRRILIFPEEHTRNRYYLENVQALQRILQAAPFEVQVGSEREEILKFRPDLILINNDLTAGSPEALQGLPTLLLPSPRLGWHSRRKSNHFRLYENLIGEVASLLKIDPWLLSPLSTLEKEIDLNDADSLRRLQGSADRLLDLIRQKYQEHGIRQDPYLFVKNDAGTYGIGIIHIHSGDELLALGRRKKNKLGSSKGGRVSREFLLQEGIPTQDRHEGKPIEPVVYLVGGEAVGAFFRVHTGKNELESLNAPGMSFSCLCLHKFAEPKRIDALFQTSALLGKVASLAAALESDYSA